jgi:hypothetical protein
MKMFSLAELTNPDWVSFRSHPDINSTWVDDHVSVPAYVADSTPNHIAKCSIVNLLLV